MIMISKKQPELNKFFFRAKIQRYFSFTHLKGFNRKFIETYGIKHTERNNIIFVNLVLNLF